MSGIWRGVAYRKWFKIYVTCNLDLTSFLCGLVSSWLCPANNCTDSCWPARQVIKVTRYQPFSMRTCRVRLAWSYCGNGITWIIRLSLSDFWPTCPLCPPQYLICLPIHKAPPKKSNSNPNLLHPPTNDIGLVSRVIGSCELVTAHDSKRWQNTASPNTCSIYELAFILV